MIGNAVERVLTNALEGPTVLDGWQSSNAACLGASPSLAAIFQGVMSAEDGLVRNEEVAGATPATLTIWKAGRYKLAASVLKTRSARVEVGALPTPSASLR